MTDDLGSGEGDLGSEALWPLYSLYSPFPPVMSFRSIFPVNFFLYIIDEDGPILQELINLRSLRFERKSDTFCLSNFIAGR